MNLWGHFVYLSMQTTGMFHKYVFLNIFYKSVTAPRGRFLNRGQGKVGCKALKSLSFGSQTVKWSLKCSEGQLESQGYHKECL